MDSLKTILKGIWWLPVLVLLGWLWLKEHDEKVLYRAQAEQRIEEVQEAVKVLKQLDSSVKAQDSSLQVQRKQLQADREARRMEEARARLRTTEAVAALQATLDSSQQVLLASVVAGYEHRLELKDQQLVDLTRELRIADSQIVIRDSLIAQQNRMVDSLVNVWLRAEKRLMKGESLGSKIVKYGGYGLAIFFAVKP